MDETSSLLPRFSDGYLKLEVADACSDGVNK